MTSIQAEASNDMPTTTASRSERRSPKRLLKPTVVFFCVAIAILVGIGSLNYWLNPLTYSTAEQKKAAAVLMTGHNIAIPDSNLDWRELRREHIKLMPTAPDVVIFGGSRWQEATNEVAPTKRIYNAFVSNDHFEDMMAIAELLDSAHRMPKTLVLSVRFSTFEYLDRREAWWWKSFTPEYKAMAERLGVTTHSWWDLASIGKWVHLLSADALMAKLKQYSAVQTRWQATASPSDPMLDVVGPDGALRFSEQRLRVMTPDFAEKDAMSLAAVNREKRLKIDQPLLGQLETLLVFLKSRGVQVVLAQTPFHPAYLNGIKGSAYYDDLMQIEKEINSVAGKTGTLVVGSFDAIREGCDRSDYRDFNHSRVQCLKLLVAQIPNL